tara:strand:- start:6098 stop:6607 length:510 start_codon:yes stop_codon:yes gene_type:complete
MGLTALLSTLLGFLGGALPDLIKELRDSRSHSRELDFLQKQHDLQLERMKLEAGSKMREAEQSLLVEEVRATREHMTAIIENQAKPTGIAWIDGFNALLRPMAAFLILIMFIITAGGFVGSVLSQYSAGEIKSAKEMAEVIWGSLIGFSIEAVMGFLFGARQVRKASTT